jgi:chloramphenicol O-acetyltransferase type B
MNNKDSSPKQHSEAIEIPRNPEKENETNSPDRIIGGKLKPIRSLLRWFRIKTLLFRKGKVLTLGKNTHVGKNFRLFSPEYAKFGNNVRVGSDFRADTNVIVGDNTLISSNVSFVGNDHRIDDPTTNIFWSGRLPSCTTIIEGNSLIGYGTIVVGNVRIGYGAVVGAGSVVTRDLPPNTICVGVPAKPIKARYS